MRKNFIFIILFATTCMQADFKLKDFGRHILKESTGMVKALCAYHLWRHAEKCLNKDKNADFTQAANIKNATKLLPAGAVIFSMKRLLKLWDECNKPKKSKNNNTVATTNNTAKNMPTEELAGRGAALVLSILTAGTYCYLQ